MATLDHPRSKLFNDNFDTAFTGRNTLVAKHDDI